MTFFLCSFVKGKVYATEVNSMKNLKIRNTYKISSQNAYSKNGTLAWTLGWTWKFSVPIKNHVGWIFVFNLASYFFLIHIISLSTCFIFLVKTHSNDTLLNRTTSIITWCGVPVNTCSSHCAFFQLTRFTVSLKPINNSTNNNNC